MGEKIKAAAYYFPNYHIDPRNEAIHGKGWSEWVLMKLARPRFPGHQQPKIPLWGYENEADPNVMAKKIAAATQHGLDAFIFDWYWYEGPFLQRCLDEGFLKAENCNDMKFALMWANHDWKNIHPIGRETSKCPTNFPWTTRRETVGYVWDYIIDRYLTKPNYMRVGGLPYFSIYAVNRFIGQMGGVEATAEVIALLREKAVKAGLPGVHVNGIWFDVLDSHPACSECPQSDWVKRIGFSSYTSYNNCCINDSWYTVYPRIDYTEQGNLYLDIARRAMDTLPAPYFPVVTAGWDSTPRCEQSDMFEVCTYPWLAVMEGTPEAFGNIIEKTIQLLREHSKQEQLFIINAWNEWTEGSYIEPDQKYGLAFLQALKEKLDA